MENPNSKSDAKVVSVAPSQISCLTSRVNRGRSDPWAGVDGRCPGRRLSRPMSSISTSRPTLPRTICVKHSPKLAPDLILRIRQASMTSSLLRVGGLDPRSRNAETGHSPGLPSCQSMPITHPGTPVDHASSASSYPPPLPIAHSSCT